MKHDEILNSSIDDKGVDVTITPEPEEIIGVSALPTTPKQATLFSNPIDNNRAFGISRTFSDKLKRLTEEITPENVKESYRYGDKKTFMSKDDKGNDLALRVRDEKGVITNEQEFYDALAKIKSGKTLQTLLALWAYSNERGSFYYNGVRLSKVMSTVLKTSGGYFTQPQKREFTEAIHQLRDFEIYLDETITDSDDRGRKKQVIKREFYRLIDLVGATYAKRSKDLVDDETGKVIAKKGSADESVIIKLYGELLPRFNKGIMRGRLYSRGLLELDANKDERAILLGFKLLTRFDQMRQAKKGSKDAVKDANLYLCLDRKTLIEWADYKQTDEMNSTVANHQLIKTLDKLVAIKCLRDYEPKQITTDDHLKIKLYPHPIALKTNLIEEKKDKN